MGQSLSWENNSYSIPGQPLPIIRSQYTVHGLLVQCLAGSNLSQQVTGDRITGITELRHWPLRSCEGWVPPPAKFDCEQLCPGCGLRVFAKFFPLFS